MAFKIATWNVNSLRVRLPHVLDWLKTHQPDVLALQELKMQADDFPFAEIEQAGYHAEISAQRTYNGVAVLSKIKGNNVVTDFPDLEDPQRRVLGATIGDLRILNLYVPNGESLTSEKYSYKMKWLQHLDAYVQQEIKIHPNIIILGDFNIAPAEIDVYDPIGLEGRILCSDNERKAFQGLLQIGFNDCFRSLYPEEQHYSWWDYRLFAFKRNWGMRIDHVLATKPLLDVCANCYIDKTPRALERPSDHAPVVAEFNL